MYQGSDPYPGTIFLDALVVGHTSCLQVRSEARSSVMHYRCAVEAASGASLYGLDTADDVARALEPSSLNE